MPITISGSTGIAGVDGSASTPAVQGTDTNTGLIFGSDIVSVVTGGTTRTTVDSSGNFQYNNGYGSVATVYGCRAWVNFNGTGTVAIRTSGNVSSITDNGTGDYTVNFATAMPDANYSISLCTHHTPTMVSPVNTARGNPTASLFHVYTLNASFATTDATYVFAAVFR